MAKDLAPHLGLIIVACVLLYLALTLIIERLDRKVARWQAGQLEETLERVRLGAEVRQAIAHEERLRLKRPNSRAKA